MKRNGTNDQQISDKRTKVIIEVRHCLICHKDVDFNEDGSSRKNDCIVECEFENGDERAYFGNDCVMSRYCIICDPYCKEQSCPNYCRDIYKGPHISNQDELEYADKYNIKLI